MGMGWIKMVVAVMGLMESAKAVSIYPERFCFITETMSEFSQPCLMNGGMFANCCRWNDG